ncbi:MAG: thiol peroxidase [Chlamydiales bacterium]
MKASTLKEATVTKSIFKGNLMTKRTVTLKENTFTIEGKEMKVGRKIPECTLVNQNMEDVKLSSYSGKVMLILTVPSFDTPVCQVEGKRFNKEVGKFGESLCSLGVSMDLPFAQKRWCGAEKATNLQLLSDFRYGELGEKFGLRIKELGLLARSVYIIDLSGTVRYEQIVQEISNEPDYARAIEEIEQLLCEV